jgi:hypothetical protein
MKLSSLSTIALSFWYSSGSDDSLGNGFRKIQYVDIKNEIVNVGFNESDQEVLARYKVEVLGIENHSEA